MADPSRRVLTPVSNRAEDGPARIARRGVADPRAAHKLVFHADDLGLTHGFNEAIGTAHQRGLVTSTCLNVVGFAYRHALTDVLPDCPDLGTGLHLNLVECRAVLPPRRLPDLVDADGCFRGYRPLLAATLRGAVRRQALDECRAQIERALDDGVALDHLNSHRHAHMLPGLFDGVCELADRYDIPFIRATRERFHRPRPWRSAAYLLRDANAAKQALMNLLAIRNRRRLAGRNVRSSDRFVGVSFTGHGGERAIAAALAANRAPVVELLLHPCVRHDPRDRLLPASIRRYCDSPRRDVELAAACSQALAETIGAMGFELTNYRRLARETPEVEPESPCAMMRRPRAAGFSPRGATEFEGAANRVR